MTWWSAAAAQTRIQSKLVAVTMHVKLKNKVTILPLIFPADFVEICKSVWFFFVSSSTFLLRSSIILSKSCLPVSMVVFAGSTTVEISRPVTAACRIAFLKLVSFLSVPCYLLLFKILMIIWRNISMSSVLLSAIKRVIEKRVSSSMRFLPFM